MSTVITYLHKDEPFVPAETGLGRVIEITLDVAEKPIGFRIGALDGPARLVDIVPAAQAICSNLSDRVQQQQADAGRPVTCSKGCGACCHYLVAISPPEVDYLHQTLSFMDADFHRSVLAACLDAAQAILNNDIKQPPVNGQTDLTDINQWYAQLDLACPFLSDGECSIYEHRPLVCREHLVTSRPELCEIIQPQNPETVEMPVSISETLSCLAAELQRTEPQAVILPLALISNEDTLTRQSQTFNAIEMTERFAAIVTQKADAYCKLIAAGI